MNRKGNKDIVKYSGNRRGSKWYTNTKEDRMILPNEEIPEGWIPGRSKNVKHYKMEIIPLIITESD